MECIGCAKEGKYEFEALTVETLRVRDLKGEKKVQTLREFQRFALCGDCTNAYLTQVQTPGKEYAVRLLLFAALIPLGIALAAIFWRSNGALRLMGLAACFLGICGVITTRKSTQKKRDEFRMLTADEAQLRAAWERILELAPKKDGDSDLSYIPVTQETLARKNGDLMVLYDLVPAIAVEAHKRLHAHAGAAE